MSRVFLTGDLHGSLDIHKLNTKRFPEGKTLTKEDYLIICGDFGLIWADKETNKEKYWLKWLNEKPWTTIVVLGNHENYNAIYANYPKTEFNGARAIKVRDSIFIIERGEIFTINNKKFFVFGGGFSIDVLSRTENKTWWKQELPTQAEVEYAIHTLDSVNWKVDYVITHDFPLTLIRILGFNKLNMMYLYDKDHRDIQNVLEFFCISGLKYKEWFGGHFHFDADFGRFHILYQKIRELK